MPNLIITQSGRKVWALTRAEDYLVLDAIDKVQPYASISDPRWSKIEDFYLEKGTMLRDDDLITLNDHLRRRGLARIVFHESHTDSHSTFGGPDKVAIRNAILKELRNLTKEQRDVVIEQKRKEVALQPPRNAYQNALRASRLTRAPTPELREQLQPAAVGGVLTPEPAVATPQSTGEQPPVLDTRPDNSSHPALSGSPQRTLQPVNRPAPARLASATATSEAMVIDRNARFRWMHRNGVLRKVKPDDCEEWFANGWQFGLLRRRDRASDGSEYQPDPASQIKLVGGHKTADTTEQGTLGLDELERRLKARQNRVTQPTKAKYESLKAEVEELRSEMVRLKMLVLQSIVE
ncbi:hypothetical protein [Methylobacterium sp. P5_C11]